MIKPRGKVRYLIGVFGAFWVVGVLGFLGLFLSTPAFSDSEMVEAPEPLVDTPASEASTASRPKASGDSLAVAIPVSREDQEAFGKKLDEVNAAARGVTASFKTGEVEKESEVTTSGLRDRGPR